MNEIRKDYEAILRTESEPHKLFRAQGVVDACTKVLELPDVVDEVDDDGE